MIIVRNDSTNPYYNHALEEYFLNHTNKDVFILWRNRPSILIGRNQNTYSEINMDFVSQHHIDVVRRLSGGGTVFCDLGNLNFTFISTKSSSKSDFKTFATPVIQAINKLGANASFSGRNDITIDGLKVSGNAQYHTKNRLLHHGTLLYSGDLSNLAQALKTNQLKYQSKGIKSVASRVTNIINHIDTQMDVLDFKEFLINEIKETYHIDTEYILSKEEESKVIDIMNSRYTRFEWNYKLNPHYTFTHDVKHSFGLIHYQATITKGTIRSMTIEGDFFGKRSIDDLLPYLHNTRLDASYLIQDLKNNHLTDLLLSEFISGMTLDTLKQDLLQLESRELFDNIPGDAKRKPTWLRRDIVSDTNSSQVKGIIKNFNLNTVCQEANCPNQMECYSKRTATFMILGRNCTRNCTFCNVTREKPDPIDIDEPTKVATAVHRLGLKYAVITSVTRDDLDDEGAEQFAKVTKAIKSRDSATYVELLIPDLSGREELIDIVLDASPDVLNHNIETVPRLYETVRPMALYKRSLSVIKYAKKHSPHIQTKSGIMVGLGETTDEVIQVMKDLRDHQCDTLTIGQYLRPSKKHIPVVEYIHPKQFEWYKEIALSLGFKSVASGPLVRSSYMAETLSHF